MNQQPIILDVGSRTSKELKRLKNNKGVLLEKVEEAVRAKFPLSVPGNGKLTERKLVPIVLVYEKKRKRDQTVLAEMMLFGLRNLV